MDGGAIRTGRLTLRPLAAEDAEPIARLIADWEVIRWLTSPPWPFTLADAEGFIAVQDGSPRAILVDGAFAGIVDITRAGMLGYWLGRPFHRRGLMTEAATAMVAAHFRAGGGDLGAYYLPGNEPSARILTGLGFRPAGMLRREHRALAQEVDLVRLRLTRPRWEALHA